MMPMILALLLVAGTERCGSVDLCPTNADIVQAIRNFESDRYFAAQAEVAKENPGDILMMTPQTVRRVSDVYCAAPWRNEPDSVRCKFTVLRGGQTEFYSGRMKRAGDGGWQLIDPSIIVRPSKRQPQLG
jgi:hypothetical protein